MSGSSQTRPSTRRASLKEACALHCSSLAGGHCPLLKLVKKNRLLPASQTSPVASQRNMRLCQSHRTDTQLGDARGAEWQRGTSRPEHHGLLAEGMQSHQLGEKCSRRNARPRGYRVFLDPNRGGHCVLPHSCGDPSPAAPEEDKLHEEVHEEGVAKVALNE